MGLRSIRNAVVLNNDKNKEDYGRLEEAYTEIEQTLGIAAIRLEYMPQNLIYTNTVITGDTATMLFKCGDNYFNVVQQIRSVENSSGITSDRNNSNGNTVYNNWLNKTIEIQTSSVDNQKIEYSAEVIFEDSYYYLSGVIDKDDFVNIVKNLYIETGERDK